MWLKFHKCFRVVISDSPPLSSWRVKQAALQPGCLLRPLPAGSQGLGNFPAVWAAPGRDHISHKAQKHFHHLVPRPPRNHPSLPPSLCFSFAPPSPSTFPIPFSSPPRSSSLPAPPGETPTHWWKPLPLDLWWVCTSCPGSGGRHSAQLVLQSRVFCVFVQLTLTCNEKEKNIYLFIKKYRIINVMQSI